ncbi:hypothetical protein [Kaistella faecalis]|uniref:hypothetical protein n=1 Tax=Kaistella faecalis TaxID=2852098 RepID=UPI001C442DD4|nr:hypothetical protein [Chryseobacterium faecale]UFK97733.1 hypothetical protein LL667_12345 [Chryseobacterium faecale]
MQTTEHITPEAFMQFFRNTEKLNQLTPEDRIEIFRTVLLGSSDLTKELLNEILKDYSVEHLEVIGFKS